jgi:tRNA U34 5-methylaminomethyl-2-thiouridine-forming methyltransferase MnmC
LTQTGDGSATLFSPIFDEHYHSVPTGALSETLYTHVLPALHFHKDKKSISILDICFGLGYNSYVTMIEAKKLGFEHIRIVSPEMDRSLLKSLRDFPYGAYFDSLKFLQKELLEKYRYGDDFCDIDIVVGDAREYLDGCKEVFDIVYQDAFSPKKNSILWTKEYFDALYSVTASNVIMTTYSQASSVKFSMYEAGFFIYENAQEKPRKSGTIALKQKQDGWKMIDMELKRQRNSSAKALYDKDMDI